MPKYLVVFMILIVVMVVLFAMSYLQSVQCWARSKVTKCHCQNVATSRNLKVNNTHLINEDIEFFGDDTMQGNGVDARQRWSALLCGSLGKSEANFAKSESQWLDATSSIYQYHQHGKAVFLSFGLNDVARGQNNFDEMKRCIYANILYCTLPKSRIVNARTLLKQNDADWKVNDMYESVGVSTASSDAKTFDASLSLSANVSGRYVGVVITVENNTDLFNHVAFTILVNGVSIHGVDPLPFFMTQLTSTNGSNSCPYLCIYDTHMPRGHNHVVEIRPKIVGNYIGHAHCDFFFGFDNPTDIGDEAKPVYVLQPTSFDYHYYDRTQIPPAGSAVNMKTYVSMVQDVVYDLQINYGLPITFISNTLMYDFGNVLSDLFHPSSNGHRAIAERISSFL